MHDRWVSALDRGWQGALTAELSGRTFDCSEHWGTEALGVPPALIPRTEEYRVIRLGAQDPSEDCIAAGDAVLGYYDVETRLSAVMLYLAVYYAVLHVLTYAALAWATARRRRSRTGALK